MQRGNRLAQKLAEYGVVPKKSLTAKATGLETDRHFWRGVVDGDGCLSWCCRKGWQTVPTLALCGALPLVTQFRDYCSKVVGGADKIYIVGNCASIKMVSRRAGAMIHHLYHGCGVALDRKMERARRTFALPNYQNLFRYIEAGLPPQIAKRGKGALYEHEGRCLPLADWAREKNLSPSVLYHRVNRKKWPIAIALDTPLGGFSCWNSPAGRMHQQVG